MHNDYEVWDLARQQRGVKVLDRSLVFSTFFTAGAVELLQTMPNLFWFWNVVCYATGDSKGTTLIDDSTIRRVIDRLRDCRAAFYDLKKPIDQLSASEMAALVAEGVILFKTAEWQHLNGAELVFNPMFQPHAEG